MHRDALEVVISGRVMQLMGMFFFLLLCKARSHVSRSRFALRMFSKHSDAIYQLPLQVGQEVVIKIQDILNNGLGLGRVRTSELNGFVVMVPFVCIDEIVRVSITHNRGTYCEGELIDIVERNNLHRTDPVCPYFTKCDGCSYQHININSQRQIKEKQVKGSLQKIANLQTTDLKFNPIVFTDNTFNYRSKLTPHVSQLENNNVVIGFQNTKNSEIIDIDECAIASKPINAKFKQQKLKYKAKFNAPQRKTLLFREWDNGVETEDDVKVVSTINGFKFSFYSQDFFQVNYNILPKLLDYVQSLCVGFRYLIDCYCGSGLFSIGLSGHFDAIYGVEINKKSVETAKENLKNNGLANKNIHFLAASADAIFQQVESKHKLNPAVTCVIIDPPRKGVDDKFLRQLQKYKYRRLIYISCEPTTQSRDIKKLLEIGYEIVEITPFDLFPNTKHIENVIVLNKI